MESVVSNGGSSTSTVKSKKSASPSATKSCRSCGLDKPVSNFKTNGYEKDGSRSRMATCRPCMEETKLQRKISPSDSVSNVGSSNGSSNGSSTNGSSTTNSTILDINETMKILANKIR